MRASSITDLFRKLFLIGSMLGMVSASEMGASTVAPPPPENWISTSTYQTSSLASQWSDAEIACARAEIEISRGVLAAEELYEEVAFDDYLSAVDSALDAYEGAATEKDTHRYINLSMALSMARTTLLDSVVRLSSWTAIARATGVESRFVPVPDRFVSASFMDARGDFDFHPDHVVETWLDLESMDS